VFRNVAFIFFEKLEIMLAPKAKGACDNFSILLVSNQLHLLGMSPLFATLMLHLVFLDAQSAVRWYPPAPLQKWCRWVAAPACQAELARTYKSIFHILDRPTNRSLVDAIGLCNMKFCSILMPVHQGHKS
jgi:hypothetical protein